MKELDELREWLAAQKGDWSRISRHTDISTRTIYRIVNDTEYKVKLLTYLALNRERLHELSRESLAAA